MKLLLVPFFLVIHLTLYAQFDEKFYFPSNNWTDFDAINYDSFIHKVEQDTITSYLLYPTQQKAKATILYFHGNGGNVSSYIKYVEPLLESGFQVFMVDFRGYGKSTGKPTHLNILSDGKLFFDFAITHKKVVSKPIIICAVSMGSQIATYLARKYEGKISALILDSGISSLSDIALSFVPKNQHSFVKNSLRLPYSAKEDIQYLEQVKVLFIHSKTDKVVPFHHYQIVKQNCKAPNQSLIYDGKHIAYPVLFTQRYIEAINTLLN
ncbi:alpha/beta hydrolase [Bernardetia sp.]|uniref:alpha/beta hydrolase n=1 Tax=Bernardetia sp. TaxID=1937974 RepID=UPI0025BC2B10|nr:alpha/beta fold hydrolase [Bernardetia sp.]